ncbi:hypothetical protein MNBD_NITROSPIRAE01-1408 [hydrothermal vent metagenome]|uniref:Fibronectin type-III domain-containing protein n=1 Tax=hydrothermal vent metagenome TaxID=652676 RepID=A0A3B1DF73_9ZZZZ
MKAILLARLKLRSHSSLNLSFLWKSVFLVQSTFFVLLFVLNPHVFAGSAILSWDANSESDLSGYKVYFGTSSGSYGTPTTVGNVTTYTVPDLNTGTYYFAVTAFDTSGNESGFSTEVSKTLASADTTAPVVSNISATSISDDGATISWTTNEASDTQVEYGTSTLYGASTSLNTSMVTAHSVALTGLNDLTLYHYRVLSRDAAGNITTSGDQTFTTTAAPDTTAPSISNIASGNFSMSAASITWTTNEAADSRIEYGTDTLYGSFTTLNSSLVTAHSQNITGLSAGTSYHFRVLSKDAASNLATSGNNTFTTTALPGDTSGPVISSINVGNISPSGAIVTWSTDEAASSQVEYGTTSSYGSLSALNSSLVISHSRILSGLSPSTVYHYRVISKDTADNSSISGDGSFTSAGVSADTTGPAISSVLAQNITTGSATLTWTTDEPATSQVDYGLTNVYGSSTTKNETLLMSHQQIVTGLSAGSTYHFSVKSKDAAGNLSSSSDDSFQTVASESADTSAPADVERFVASGSTQKVVLGWTNPSDSDFSGVRIRFKTDGFPADINDGESFGDISGSPGATMEVEHTGLSEGVTYYYLAASYDTSGNFQSTVFASAKTQALSSSDPGDSGGASSGGGGCGLIRPGDGGGEPPTPGDAAGMLTLMGFLLLVLVKKGILKTMRAKMV